MNVKSNYIFISIIFIINIYHIFPLKFAIHKIQYDQITRSLLNVNETTQNQIGQIPLKPPNEGLYTLSLNIGKPCQKFNVLLDTVTSLIWVNNQNCKSCQSENKFIPSSSMYFEQTPEVIKINYISGEISGNICKDYIEFNDDSASEKFNFILINETNLNYKLDGIFGLSKGVANIRNLEYSTSYQIQRSKIFEKNIFLLDFPKNTFYIDEIPSYLKEYYRFSCKNTKMNKFDNYYWNCIYENIKFNHELIQTNSSTYNYIIFNSGTNCLIFPRYYMALFNDIISNNKLLKDSKCSIKMDNDNNNIYELICDNNINDAINGKNKEYKNIYNNKEFVSLYLNKDNKIFFKLSELYDKDNMNFKIYFTETHNDAIVLGIPFFEKYTILLDKDNNEIFIYDGIKNKGKKNIYKTIFSAVFIGVIVLLLILLIYIIIRKKRQLSSNQLEKSFSSDSGIMSPEMRAINEE